MTVKALGELLATVLPELAQRREQAKRARADRQRAVGGGAKRKLAPAQEVLLVLIYLRHDVAHEVIGHLFGVSADLSENPFHELLPLLELHLGPGDAAFARIGRRVDVFRHEPFEPEDVEPPPRSASASPEDRIGRSADGVSDEQVLHLVRSFSRRPTRSRPFRFRTSKT